MIKKLLTIMGIALLIAVPTTTQAASSIGVTPSYLKMDVKDNLSGTQTIDLLNMGDDGSVIDFECYIDSESSEYDSYFSLDTEKGTIPAEGKSVLTLTYDFPDTIDASEVFSSISIKIKGKQGGNVVLNQIIEVPVFSKFVDNTTKVFDASVGELEINSNSYTIKNRLVYPVRLALFDYKAWKNFLFAPLNYSKESKYFFDNSNLGEDKLWIDVEVPITNNNDFSIFSNSKTTITGSESRSMLLDATVGNIIVQPKSSKKSTFNINQENVIKLS
ncbi:MAG: hypothetical protein ACRC5M_07465, partial [Anaeroplasmataceae bacterium]